MSLSRKQSMTITPTGVGRKDWTQQVEVSVEQQLRSLQQRFFYSVHYTGLAGVVFPNVYESPLSFLVNGVLQNTAPTTRPWMFYLCEVSTDKNCLCVIAFNRYNSYSDYLAGNVAEHLGTAYGYGSAKLIFTKGIPTTPGSVYTIQYAELCGVVFNMDVTIHGLIGGPEQLE